MSINQPWEEIYIARWSDFDSIANKLPYRKWLFRGHSDAAWGVNTSYFRLIEDIQSIIKAHTGHNRVISRDVHEKLLIKKFIQSSHLFLSHVPKLSEKLEWLAIMQHYGTSTRLLDVTYSPYIAAYFALEHGDSDCCVFAFDHELLSSHLEQISNKTLRKKIFDNLKDEHSFIVPFEPQISNQRMVAQQGLFLVPSNNYISFQNILLKNNLGIKACKKIIISKKLRYEGIKKLHRMNITSASLFPGIDGFCRSLKFQILETSVSQKSIG